MGSHQTPSPLAFSKSNVESAKLNNNTNGIQKRVFGLLGLFVLQFIFGMTLNLFVSLPKVHSGTTGAYVSRAAHSYSWAITNGGGTALTIHALIALGMIVGGLFTLIFSIKQHAKSWIISSAIGLLFLVSAAINGLNFISLGGHDANSMAMAVSYIIAFVAYGAGLYINK
jgi:hypothetical protein